MVSQSKKPAVLIIHGASTDAVLWDRFCSIVTADGYVVRCPQLPSSSRTPVNKDIGIQDDAAVIRAAARDLIAKGESMVVLAHSQGGKVACEAINKELYYTPETGTGIQRIIFLSAHVSSTGKDTQTVWKENGFPSILESAFEDGVVRVVNPEPTFFNDMDEEAAKAAAEIPVYQSYLSLAGEPKQTPWRDLPTTYILCEKDQCIFPWLQEKMAKDLMADRAGIKMVSLNSGHSPYLSMPDELFETIKNILKS